MELYIFVHETFDVEASCRNGGDSLIEFQLVEDGYMRKIHGMLCGKHTGLSGIVEPQHQQSYLPHATQSLKETRKEGSHLARDIR